MFGTAGHHAYLTIDGRRIGRWSIRSQLRYRLRSKHLRRRQLQLRPQKKGTSFVLSSLRVIVTFSISSGRSASPRKETTTKRDELHQHLTCWIGALQAQVHTCTRKCHVQSRWTPFLTSTRCSTFITVSVVHMTVFCLCCASHTASPRSTRAVCGGADGSGLC